MIGFGLGGARAASARDWLDRARHAEEVGYEILHVSDHLGGLSPTAALAAAAAVTERILIGAYVLNNDFRHPLLVAQESASLDLLSDGRLEVGLGAGWNMPEYREAGIPFEPASVRIDRLEEAATILRMLFDGSPVSYAGDHYTITGHALEPHPPQGSNLPIAIGGNGDRVLDVAGRLADVIGFTGFTFRRDGPSMDHFSEEGLANRVEVVRKAAGARFPDLRLTVLVQFASVSDDSASVARELAAGFTGPDAPTPAEILASPFYLVGSRAQVVTKVERLERELGITRFTVLSGRSEGFDEVVRLFGR